MSVAEAGFEETPTITGLVLAFVPAVVAVLASTSSLVGTLAAATGTVVVLAGIRLADGRLVTIGTVALFGGVLLAGSAGTPVVQVMVGAGAAVLAWDAASNAIEVGRQLGRRAATTRLQFVHSAATAAVATVVGTGAMGVYWASRGGEPTAAVVLLLLAAVAFTWLLDR